MTKEENVVYGNLCLTLLGERGVFGFVVGWRLFSLFIYLLLI